MNERWATSRLSAGLQTGMAGALVMLGWLALTSLWSRHSIWWFANLMATTFGGDAALRADFGKYTAAGIALHLVQFCALGAVFAAVVPERTTYTRLLLYGLITSMAFYYLMYGVVWKHLNPLVPLYSPDRPILVGHIFFGFMLARLGRYRAASMPITE